MARKVGEEKYQSPITPPPLSPILGSTVMGASDFWRSVMLAVVCRELGELGLGRRIYVGLFYGRIGIVRRRELHDLLELGLLGF